jgi:arabinogalactan endo-1,4-beta-galactosidase
VDGALDGTAPPTDAGGPVNPSFIIGADITFSQEDVAGGTVFVDTDGQQKSIFALLKNHGFNYVRMRTFVDPTQPAPNPAGGTFPPYSTQGFGDLAHTIAYGQQIKAVGMGFLLDFHYSDTWADPGKQIKPAAWVNDTLAQAVTDLHDYTVADIQALVAAGARPDMVQIGNEITSGMLLTPGTALGAIGDFAQLAQLLNAGIQAVHEVDPTIQIMLHLDRGGDLSSSRNFIDNCMNANPKVVFDVFGESCYVAFQGGPSVCGPVLQSLAAAYPTLKLAIAEYNTDPAGQTDTQIRQINDIVFNLPNKLGAGTFFWEPTRDVNADNLGMFTTTTSPAPASVTTSSPIPACITQYDAMKTAYGL